jgi:hypothetical protein
MCAEVGKKFRIKSGAACQELFYIENCSSRRKKVVLEKCFY